jgi:hypothetical protein
VNINITGICSLQFPLIINVISYYFAAVAAVAAASVVVYDVGVVIL